MWLTTQRLPVSRAPFRIPAGSFIGTTTTLPAVASGPPAHPGCLVHRILATTAAPSTASKGRRGGEPQVVEADLVNSRDADREFRDAPPLHVYRSGWFGFFSVCSGEERTMQSLDAHIRRRLRAIHLNHWKNGTTIARNLIARGAKHKAAWTAVYDGHRNTWSLSHCPAVDRALNRSFFVQVSLVSLVKRWAALHRPVVIAAPQEQLPLFGW